MSTGHPVEDVADDPADDALDIGEEVGRLTEALAGWWTSVTAAPPAPRGVAGSASENHNDDHHGGDGPDQHGHSHAAPAGESCRVCPLCRALDIARAARPDLLTQVAAAAETVALLLREAAAGPRPAEPDDAADTSSTGLDDGSTSGTRPWPPGTPIVVRDADQATPDQRRDAPWD